MEYLSTSSAWHHLLGRFKKSSMPSRRNAAISECASPLISNRQRPCRRPNSISLWEFMSRFTLPFCSALPRSPPPSSSAEGSTTPSSQPSLPPITATTSIIDLGGVSLGLMWSLRRHLQQASELATAHYPETLHTIAVVNAPAFFPVVWSWIKVCRPLLFIRCINMHPLSRLPFAGLIVGLVR